jgi:hypothetical protein
MKFVFMNSNRQYETFQFEDARPDLLKHEVDAILSGSGLVNRQGEPLGNIIVSEFRTK